jgi:hypothetical protein
MYAEYYPGISKYNNDTKQHRITWFQECLNQISQINNIASIAMPYNIGCGAAGGDWDVYFQMINNFANNYQIHVTLYKLY